MGATRLARGTTAYVLRTGRPAHIDLERFHELEEAGEVDAVGTIGDVGDWIGAPLVADGRTLGAIVVQSYSAEGHDLLAFVGQHHRVGRARAIEETRERNGRALINEIGEALAKQLEFDAIINLVGERVRTIFSARGMFIALSP